jgi:hypothetical protein
MSNGQWPITKMGREYVENPPKLTQAPPQEPPQEATQEPPQALPQEPPRATTQAAVLGNTTGDVAVPSQADLFK